MPDSDPVGSLPSDSTLRIAADIVIAAIQSKTLTLMADPKSRQSTSEHDAAQIARAFVTVHDAIFNEHRRTSART